MAETSSSPAAAPALAGIQPWPAKAKAEKQVPLHCAETPSDAQASLSCQGVPVYTGPPLQAIGMLDITLQT